MNYMSLKREYNENIACFELYCPFRGNFIDFLNMIENNDIAEIENFYFLQMKQKQSQLLN